MDDVDVKHPSLQQSISPCFLTSLKKHKTDSFFFSFYNKTAGSYRYGARVMSAECRVIRGHI